MSFTVLPEGTSLMSATMKFGRAGSTELDRNEIHSSARRGWCGSIHRYISCGLIFSPALEVGTQLEMKRGWTGSRRSKNLKSNGKVVSLPAGQAWITELQRKVITISSFFCGHTRSSRVVIPTWLAWGAPISPTTFGLDGWAASTTRIPGCGCAGLRAGPWVAGPAGVRAVGAVADVDVVAEDRDRGIHAPAEQRFVAHQPEVGGRARRAAAGRPTGRVGGDRSPPPHHRQCQHDHRSNEHGQRVALHRGPPLRGGNLGRPVHTRLFAHEPDQAGVPLVEPAARPARDTTAPGRPPRKPLALQVSDVLGTVRSGAGVASW